jgi:serine/threonine protein kinase
MSTLSKALESSVSSETDPFRAMNMASDASESSSPSGDDNIWKAEYFSKYLTFAKHFKQLKVLGNGSDGVVTLYQHKRNPFCKVAVKTPKRRVEFCVNAIAKEVINLEIVGNHDHCVGMIGSIMGFQADIGWVQAAILPHCEWGDATKYQRLYHNQQYNAGKGEPIPLPEVTVLKLLRDISLGLDYLHNSLGTAYVHGDLKPDNILVSSPSGYTGAGVPLEPIFKIADFARLKPYPSPAGQRPHRFFGTPAYAPPHSEHYELRPSCDIWMLGATIQEFALNLCPLESIHALEKRFGMVGRDHHPQFLDNQRAMYRPLHATAEVLRSTWSIEKRHHKYIVHHKPYSSVLNMWYKQLFDMSPEQRITAAHLVKCVVPAIDIQMAIARRMAAAEDWFARAQRLREEVEASRGGLDDFTVQSKLRPVNYEEGYTTSLEETNLGVNF